MTYENVSHELDKVAADIKVAGADGEVVVPWARALAWTADGKIDMLIAHANNLLGITKNEGGDYKLYYGRENAGKSRYAVWGAFKSAFVAGVIGAYLSLWFKFGEKVGVYNLYGLFLALLGVYLFSGKAAYVFRASQLYKAVAKPGYTGSLTIAAVMTLACASAALGNAIRLYDVGFNFADILSAPLNPSLKGDKPLWTYALPLVFYVLLALAVQAAAWIFDVCFFSRHSRKSGLELLGAAGVTQELYDASTYDAARYSDGAGAVVSFGALWVLVMAGGLFFAYY